MNEPVYEEIDIMKYARIFTKRKTWIINSTLIACLGAIIFTIISPPVYTIQGSIEVGMMDQKTFIENPQELVARVEIENERINATNPKDTPFVIMEMESSNPEEAVQRMLEVQTSILGRHSEVIEERRVLLQENRNHEESLLEFFKAEMQASSRGQDAFREYFISSQLRIAQSQIDSLTEELENIQETTIMQQPNWNQPSFFREVLLNVVVAGVLGFLVAIVVVSVREATRPPKIPE